MDISTKIKLAATYAGISESELARRLGMSPQSLNKRLKTGKFTSEDLENFAEALGARYNCFFEFPDGQKSRRKSEARPHPARLLFLCSFPILCKLNPAPSKSPKPQQLQAPFYSGKKLGRNFFAHSLQWKYKESRPTQGANDQP